MQKNSVGGTWLQSFQLPTKFQKFGIVFAEIFIEAKKGPKLKKADTLLEKGLHAGFFSVTNKQVSKVNNKTTTTAVTVLFKVSAALYFLFKRGSRIERQVCFKHKQLQLKQNGGSNKSFERF